MNFDNMVLLDVLQGKKALNEEYMSENMEDFSTATPYI